MVGVWRRRRSRSYRAYLGDRRRAPDAARRPQAASELPNRDTSLGFRRVSEHVIHANGVDLCAEPFGDPADPAILLLHGTGSSMLSWDEELCARLASGRRLVIRCD